MGACYSVMMKVNLDNEKAAVDALNHHITNDNMTCYSLDKYAGMGIGTASFDDLMKILLVEHQGHVEIVQEDTFKIYRNDFDASYGWEIVMTDWFKVMTPFLADGSKLLIYPDYDYDELVVENGKCVWVH